MSTFLWLCVSLFAASQQASAATTLTFNNTAPRLDADGNIMDAHDGSIQQFPVSGSNLFFYHAVQYGTCKEPGRQGCDMNAPFPNACGFRFTHNITVWTSPNLTSGSWTNNGHAIEIEDRPVGIVFRPHAAYAPAVKTYVLMWNYKGSDDKNKGYAVSYADSPYGPFSVVQDSLNVTQLGGDFDLLVDAKDTPWIIYMAHRWMYIEKLTPDMQYSTGEMAAIQSSSSPGGAGLFAQPPGAFPNYFVEAPSLFRLPSGKYVTMFGHCCCFCYQGSGLIVWIADDMAGPWVEQPGGNIACANASSTSPVADLFGLSVEPTPGEGCLYGGGHRVSTTRAQQNFVVTIPTPSGVEFILTGDRWQQSPDGLKAHDPQSYLPLRIHDNGTVGFVDWVDTFTVVANLPE